MYCANCGKWVPDESTFCEFCGSQMGGQMKGEYYNPSYTEGGYEAAMPTNASRGSIATILIGAGIGIIILMLVFGMVLFLKNNQQKSTPENLTIDFPSELSTLLSYANNSNKDKDSDSQTKTYNNYYYGYDEPRRTTNNYYYSDYYDGNYAYSELPALASSSDCYLDTCDLYGMSDDELQKAINDIYARNGLIFSTEEIQDYYEAQPWYDPWTTNDSDVWDAMSDCEHENIHLIRDYM